MKTLTAKQLAEIRASGAHVEVVRKPAPLLTKPVKPKQVRPVVDNGLSKMMDMQASIAADSKQTNIRQAKLMASIASSIDDAHNRIIEKLAKANNTPVKAQSYTFKINRNRSGFIESVDAHPID